MIKFIWQRSQFTFLAAALAISVALPAIAQTILKFSHTDYPLGSHQKAAKAFEKEAEEYTRGKYNVKYPSGHFANAPALR